jgi:general secretion pathway protein D
VESLWRNALIIGDIVQVVKNYIFVAIVFFAVLVAHTRAQASLLDFFSPLPSGNTTEPLVTGSLVNVSASVAPPSPNVQRATPQPSTESIAASPPASMVPLVVPTVSPPTPVTPQPISDEPFIHMPAQVSVPASATIPLPISSSEQASIPLASAPLISPQAAATPATPGPVATPPISTTITNSSQPQLPAVVPVNQATASEAPPPASLPQELSQAQLSTQNSSTLIPPAPSIPVDVPAAPSSTGTPAVAVDNVVSSSALLSSAATSTALPSQSVSEITEPTSEVVPAAAEIPHAEVGEIHATVQETLPHRPIQVVDEQEQDDAVKEYHERIAQSSSSRLARASYLGSYLEPWKTGPDEKIELLFENAELSAFITYIEQKFGITFILDDAIKPMPQGGKSLVGTKISFRTHAPLTKRQVWDVFVMFLDMAGVAPVPGPMEGVYRLIASKNPQSVSDATHGPLPILSGVNESLIPDNDMLIRYVYFVVRANPDTIIKAVDVLRSVASPPIIRVPEVNALIITDRAINIKTMLKVIQELDQVDGHEGLAVVKLQRADASQAAQLYADFSRQETQQSMAARLLGARKASTTEYFERGARVIPEPRTNSLIILGSREAIETIIEFVKNVVERIDERPESPHYIYKLKFQSAEPLAALLQEAVKFSAEGSSVSHFGGVRDGNKYLKPISIVPEASTNSLIISADYDDYMHLYELIKSLDIEQPQVAIRMFVLNISTTENKGFGAQIRNKVPGVNGLLGNNVNFQTSGLTEVGSGSGIVENPNNGGMIRLLGNLVSVASAAAVGSTIVQLGSDAFGVWGLLNMLQSYAKVNVVESPFFVTTNKYPAHLIVGETRRVVDANIFTQTTQSAFKDLSATLDIEITPQISSEGFVTLKVLFGLSQFTDPNVDSSNGNRTERKLETSVLLNSNQVLALGGLLREEVDETESRVPVLGSIPLVGWLFKNRTRVFTNVSILILIQAEILYPISNNPAAARITQDQFTDSRSLINELAQYSGPRDPINRLFFRDREDRMEQFIDQFASKDNVYTLDAVESRELQTKKVAEAKPCRYPYRRRKQKQEQQQAELNRSEHNKEIVDASISAMKQQKSGLAIPKPKKPAVAKKTEDITGLLGEVPVRGEDSL